MRNEDHGRLLKNAVSDRPDHIFREVDSGHQHGNQVWFGVGEDRKAIESFLRQVDRQES
jgi:hypothetical protein